MRESVNVVIQNKDGGYLLQIRDCAKGTSNPLKWNFFGGGIEANNVLAECKREIREELGVDVELSDLHLIGDVVNDKGHKVYVVTCKANLSWKDITILEGAGAGYFTKEEILKIDITFATKLIVEKYL